MDNIQEIFNRLQHEVLEEEYNSVNKSYDEYIILEREIYTNSLIETMVYNNPEKKRLDILLEEAEEKKERDVFKWIMDQMKKVLNWITNIFNHQQALFQKGADLVAANDLNQAMLRIRSKHVNATVKYHNQKPTFQTIKGTCSNKINNTIASCKSKVLNATAARIWSYEDILDREDLESTFLDNFRKKLRLRDEDANEIQITQINVLNIHNTLTMLPKANKDLENIKRKVEDLYKKLANKMRDKAGKRSIAGTGVSTTINNYVNEKKAENANDSLSRINGLMKKINEMIRAYSKVLTLVFKEDFKAAKAIVNLANGKAIGDGANDDGTNETQSSNEKKKEHGKILNFKKKAK